MIYQEEQITDQVTKRLILLFDHYNHHLFTKELGTQLKRPLLATGRLNLHKNHKHLVGGHYLPKDSLLEGKERTHSAITIDRELIGKAFNSGNWERVHACLVHEMIHQYCIEELNVKLKKNSHGHCSKWRNTMKRHGLEPVAGGSGVNKWRAADQTIVEGGLFEQAFQDLPQEERDFPEFVVFKSAKPKTPAQPQSWTRRCPVCGRGFQFHKNSKDKFLFCQGTGSTGSLHQQYTIPRNQNQAPFPTPAAALYELLLEAPGADEFLINEDGTRPELTSNKVS